MRPADTRRAVHRVGPAVGPVFYSVVIRGGVVVEELPDRGRGVVGDRCWRFHNLDVRETYGRHDSPGMIMTGSGDQEVVEAFAAQCVSIQRSAMVLARGARTGVRMMRMSAPQTKIACACARGTCVPTCASPSGTAAVDVNRQSGRLNALAGIR